LNRKRLAITKIILIVLVLLSLAGNPLIVLEAKLCKAISLREVRLVVCINIIPPGRGINTREVEKT
jgi:hypothetical protein